MTTLAAYALAGLGCSAVFPLTVQLATERFSAHTPWVASVVTAALMSGVGIATFALGPLREFWPLDTLIQASAIYPLLMLLLALVVNHHTKQTPVS
jgi:MFS family permease